MSSHQPRASIAYPGVHQYTVPDQTRDAYPGDAQRRVFESAENQAENLPQPAGSYVSAIDRRRPRPGTYTSTSPSDARPGNYTSADSASYEVGSYIDVEPAR